MPAPLDPDCIFRVLADYGVEYVLIGGLAAVIHGSPAMTNDADIVPRKEKANLARLAEALRTLEARLRSADSPEGIEFEPHPVLLESLAMLNLTTRCGDLDLAVAPSGISDYRRLVDRSIEFELAGQRVKVAALADIIQSKEAANRPKDRATLPILHALAEEIERGRQFPPF